MPNKLSEKASAIYSQFEPWQKFFGLIVGLVLAVLAGKAYVEKTARDAVQDEKFLGTLAAHVRPSLIFDTHESIEADYGAGEYISDISVRPNFNLNGFDVLIKAKRHLANAPQISAIDVNLFQSLAVRDRLNDWRIQMTPNTTAPALLLERGMDTNVLHRFRLEILH